VLSARCAAQCRVLGAGCSVPSARGTVPRPSQVRYQAALHPESVLSAGCSVLSTGDECSVPGARCQVHGAPCTSYRAPSVSFAVRRLLPSR
jgi:hypothetical protein